jgi:hypothetical protein
MVHEWLEVSGAVGQNSRELCRVFPHLLRV